MPAYYVTSGQIQVKITAKNQFDACVKAFRNSLQKNPKLRISFITIVSERGNTFKHTDKSTKNFNTDQCISTNKILEAIGSSQRFDLDDPDFVNNIVKNIEESGVDLPEDEI